MNLRAVASLLITLLGVATIQAQQPATTTPTIHVYSREILVDVAVTDSQGRPVRNLTQSDFTITEDGTPQSIRSFHEYGATSAVPVFPKLPPNTYTNLQPTSGPLNVLLFDDVNGGDIVQARWAAAKFIKDSEPGTQIALLALGDKLTVLHGPTSDAASLLKVVNLSVKPYEIEALGCTRQVAVDWTTLDQLNQVATYLSGIKGRKNLIWIGDSIPDMIWGSCQDWNLPLQKTYDHLEDAEVTVYPLDPHGVRPFPPGYPPQLAMEAVAEATGGQAFYERNDLDTLMSSAVKAGSSYYTLSFAPPSLAYDGRYHAINITVSRTGLHLTYRRGYSAEDPATILHPPNTFLGRANSPTPSPTPAIDPLTAAITPIAPPATQLLFDVRATPTAEPPMPSDPPLIGNLNPKLRSRPLTRYDLLFAVPSDEIAFNPAANGTFSGSLEFDVAAYDPAGNLVTVRSQTMKLPLTNTEYREFIATPFQFFQQLDLPPGQFTLRVGVLDGVSNKIGTLDISVTIPKK